MAATLVFDQTLFPALPEISIESFLAPVFTKTINATENELLEANAVNTLDAFLGTGCKSPSLCSSLALPSPLLDFDLALDSSSSTEDESNGANWHRNIHESYSNRAEPVMSATAVHKVDLAIVKPIRKPRNRALSTSGKERLLHSCSVCSRGFKTRNDLKRHVRTVHERQKNHACDMCGKRFGHSGHLNRHRETVHMKLRKHCCAICNDSFSQASHLRSHIAHVHNRERRHECAACSLKFVSETGLRKHLVNVHGVKPSIRCSIPGCDELFVLENDRRRHALRQHLNVRCEVKQPCFR